MSSKGRNQIVNITRHPFHNYNLSQFQSLSRDIFFLPLGAWNSLPDRWKLDAKDCREDGQ